MKFTLRIWSVAGKLWFQRTILPHQIQNMMSAILCTQGFESGLWRLEIAPDRAEADIGEDLRFLGERTPFN